MKLFSLSRCAADHDAVRAVAPTRARLRLAATIVAASVVSLLLFAGRTNAQGVSPSPPATVTTLHSFTETNGSNTDGGFPQAGLVQGSDGEFYGMAYVGGKSNYGTIFKITPAGTFTTLHMFTGKSDGAYPYSSLVQGIDGNFYGTASKGGTGHGTIFKITPSGAFTTLVAFNDTDGQAPYAGLTLGSDGNFYGTTTSGGTGHGTIFKVTPSGALTTLSTELGSTAALVEGSDGDFYGTTSGNSAMDSLGGTVFKVTPSGTVTTLAIFDGLNGLNADASASLVQASDGDFYGTTDLGGNDWVLHQNTGAGTVFKITPSGDLTTLYNFSPVGTRGVYTDGDTPLAGLVQGSNGNFYGTTAGGGPSDLGTLFEITPSGMLTTLHAFSGYPFDGQGPLGNLAQGSDGSFYGTTEDGGSSGAGTIFKLSFSDGSPTTLASLSPSVVQSGNLPFVLTATGTGFSKGVTADFNGMVLTPAFATSTKLTFNVPASLVAMQGGVTVTVANPGALPSNGLLFGISPATTLAALLPMTAPAGSPATSITVAGADFVNGCVVKWNGQPLPTYYISPFTATATIPASYLATAGTAKITVSNPHVYATDPVVFTVTAH